MEGSYRGPMKSPSKQSQDMVLETGLCPKERGFEWAFIQCPGESHRYKKKITHTLCSTRGFQTAAQGPPEVTEGCYVMFEKPDENICIFLYLLKLTFNKFMKYV